MESIQRFDSVGGAKFSKDVDGSGDVWKHRDAIGIEELLNAQCGGCVVCFEGADQEFAEYEETATESIGPLQHRLVDLLHAVA